jgi:hypothetical protein
MVSATMFTTSAFSIVTTAPSIRCRTHAATATLRRGLSSSNNNDKVEEREQEVVFVEPGSESDALSDDLWEEIEGAQPPKWIVMKEVRFSSMVA